MELMNKTFAFANIYIYIYTYQSLGSLFQGKVLFKVSRTYWYTLSNLLSSREVQSLQ